MADNLHGVFKGILNGISERGEGGVLYVKGDECAYRFASEFVNTQFRGSLERILEEDAGFHFFVVEEKDNQLHVLAYPKTRVWSHCTSQPSQPALADVVDFSDNDKVDDTVDDTGDGGASGVDDSKNPGA